MVHPPHTLFPTHLLLSSSILLCISWAECITNLSHILEKTRRKRMNRISAMTTFGWLVSSHLCKHKHTQPGMHSIYPIMLRSSIDGGKFYLRDSLRWFTSIVINMGTVSIRQKMRIPYQFYDGTRYRQTLIRYQNDREREGTKKLTEKQHSVSYQTTSII